MAPTRRRLRTTLLALCLAIAALPGCNDFRSSERENSICYGDSSLRISGGTDAALAFVALLAIAAAAQAIKEIANLLNHFDDPGIRWDSREGLALRLSRP